MNRFEVLDHTADIGIIAYGRTLEELFANAAFGMFSVIGDVTTVSPREERPVLVRADGLGPLLGEFLGELLYLFDAEHFVVREAQVEAVTDREVRASVRGEPISPAHRLHTEIKAVTHHRLRVEKTPEGWSATVLFDV